MKKDHKHCLALWAWLEDEIKRASEELGQSFTDTTRYLIVRGLRQHRGWPEPFEPQSLPELAEQVASAVRLLHESPAIEPRKEAPPDPQKAIPLEGLDAMFDRALFRHSETTQ